MVKGTPQSIDAFIFEDRNREGTAFRIFNMAPTAGYHQVIWDGTFEGIANRPPEPGVYRIDITVTGAGGKSERLFEQIRVENPGNETVLPRVRSGLAISSLTFDGKIVVVTDTGGNTIVVPATSGLKPSTTRTRTRSTTPIHSGSGSLPRGRSRTGCTP